MIRTAIEYIGFQADETGRSYRLRVCLAGGEFQQYVLSIAHEAFTSHRVRYQDAPELCYLKLQRDLASGADTPVPLRQLVTDAELDAYRVDHAPKLPIRRFAAT
jgi:hypothetical protein